MTIVKDSMYVCDPKLTGEYAIITYTHTGTHNHATCTQIKIDKINH